MKILVQWSLDSSTDWIETDSSQWQSLPKREVPLNPRGSDVIDDKPGWISAINIQGYEFDGYDHYAIKELADGSGGIKVTAWNDDPEDWPDGKKHAIITTFLPLTPDLRFGGAYNTWQYNVIYTQPVARRQYPAKVDRAEFRSWADFVPPIDSLVRHGIWMTDSQFKGHVDKRSLHGWREWTEGVPAEFIENGKVIRQAKLGFRPLKEGTITYYGRNTDRAIGAYVATYEDAFEKTTGTAATENIDLPPADPAASVLGWAFSTPASEPNSADWPNGTYKFQIDCSANSGVNYGLLTLNAKVGKFARVSSDLASELEYTQQAEGAFSGTGLMLATAVWNPSAGSAGDRFCVVVACQSTSTHAVKSISLELNEADDYGEGPWSVGAATYTKTYDLGARLFKEETQDYTLAARFFKIQTKDYDLSGRFLKTQEKTYDLAARFQKQALTKTYDLAVRLFSQETKAYTLIGNIIGRYPKTYTLGARFIQTGTKIYDLNARLLETLTKTYDLSARLVKSYPKTYTLAGRLYIITSKTFTLGAGLWAYYPTVTTEAATDVDPTSAVLHGTITNIKGKNCSIRGFEWGTSPGVYTDTWTETGDFGTGSFQHTISGLDPGTNYYYRAKAAH